MGPCSTEGAACMAQHEARACPACTYRPQAPAAVLAASLSTRFVGCPLPITLLLKKKKKKKKPIRALTCNYGTLRYFVTHQLLGPPDTTSLAGDLTHMRFEGRKPGMAPGTVQKSRASLSSLTVLAHSHGRVYGSHSLQPKACLIPIACHSDKRLTAIVYALCPTHYRTRIGSTSGPRSHMK